MVQDTFKCGQCNVGYDDLDEYRDHISNEVHTHSGISACNQCGNSTEYKFTGKLAKGKFPALCKTCKDDLIGGSE